MEAECSFFKKYFFNKNTSVPPAPKPVRARAIAEKVKLPKPSTRKTLINEISRARREEDVKKSAGRYNSAFYLLYIPSIDGHYDRQTGPERIKNARVFNTVFPG
jgi:hypothetical protein